MSVEANAAAVAESIGCAFSRLGSGPAAATARDRDAHVFKMSLGQSHDDSDRHEHFLAAKLGLKPGFKAGGKQRQEQVGVTCL